MKKIFVLCLLCLLSLTGFTQTPNPLKGKKVLVFSLTKGYRHGSIPSGIQFMQDLAKQYEFQVDTTENPNRFNENNLKQYRVVVFLCTTGDVLSQAQQTAFERFIQAGGGYMGVHSATDTEYDWAWYGKLAGGYFASHPGNPNVQKGTMYVLDKNHPSTEFMPDSFERTDEFYDIKNFNTDVKTLIRVDEKSYKDGKMGDFHPMAWYHEYDGGRAFYTNYGHTNETFKEPLMIQHFWGGLRYVASGGEMDYQKARSEYAPEENRFLQKVLDEKLDEPTELAVFDDGRVIYVERKGKVRVYNPVKKKSKVVAQMPVYTKFEYGLMGVGIDPNFAKNHWIYMYYSPVSDAKGDTAQHLSRFVYDEVKDTIVMASEKVMLRVPVKRTDCCHTGGSIAWDKKGNLYLSAGDDTNPFNSDGYAPIDNRPGRAGWDARASSSNTNDLRGKIMRIKPNDDGTYDIPEGNLFAKGTEKARPEIYVMGNRNPYRIAVDQRTGFLYWGEVGPDAGEESAKYGPRGHDEVNQARQAGYFGWPLFVGNNKAYNARNFADSTTGAKFDANKPINDSPHNTGLRELPPAQKAFIWYPYAESKEFPLMGTGGRNAMAGPVYYYDDYNSPKKFPKYFDKKFISYEWMRDKLFSVTLKENGDYGGMEQMLPGFKFSHPMDMAFGKDGTLYLLEYGPNWFAQNDEARLTQIEYIAGNRPPVAQANADKKVGSLPLKVAFSSKGSMDYDGDAIKYQWTFAKGVVSNLPNPTYTYTKAGVYKPTLKVTDAAGNITTTTLEIKVGNDVPKVEMVVHGNKTFYWNGQKTDYEVKVSDKEDGSLADKRISDEDVRVAINYLDGYDKTMIAQGHQMNTNYASGKRLIDLSDCKACHSVDKKSIGPTYTDIAKKYRPGNTNIARLSEKIIKGGSGVWGQQAMAAHPQISNNDAREMVQYILSLADTKKASQPVKGSYDTAGKAGGTYIFSAYYTDKGANGISPQTGESTVVLRSNKMKAVAFDAQKDIMRLNVPQVGGDVAVATTHQSYLVYNDIDLTGINSISFMATASDERTAGGNIELHLDSPTGTLVGSAEVGKMMKPAKISTTGQSGVHNLYIVFTNPDSKGKALMAVIDLTFEKK